MGIFDGCLLACDIDDTLVKNGYINPKNIEKIHYFISEGGKNNQCCCAKSDNKLRNLRQRW